MIFHDFPVFQPRGAQVEDESRSAFHNVHCRTGPSGQFWDQSQVIRHSETTSFSAFLRVWVDDFITRLMDCCKI